MNFDIVRNKLQSNTPEIISEAYYGKTLPLIKAEKIIEKMQDAYTNGSNADLKKFYQYGLELEKIFEDMFGFTDVYINRTPIAVYFNQTNVNNLGAATLCMVGLFKKTIWGVEPFYHKRENTMKFNKSDEVSAIILVDGNLFKRTPAFSLTPQEIMAILLHEIGHNFYHSEFEVYKFIFMTICSPTSLIYGTIWDAAMLANIQIERNFGNSKQAESFMEFILKFNRNIFDYIKNIVSLTNPALAFIYGVITLCISISSGLLVNIPLAIVYTIGKDAEIFSDAFATSYGYGEALSTALFKLDDYDMIAIGGKTNKLYDKIDAINTFLKVPIRILRDVFSNSSHPSNPERLKKSIRYLEANANNIENPKLRKQCLSDIAKIEKLKHELKTNPELTKYASGKLTAKEFEIMDRENIDSPTLMGLLRIDTNLNKFDSKGDYTNLTD